MIADLILLLLLAVPSVSAASAKRLLERMERIESRMETAHPSDRKSASKKLNAFRSKFQDKGLIGARALALYIVETRRPLRVRLHAAAFLGTIGEPETYGALAHVAKNQEDDPGLRSTAILALASLRIPTASRRDVFEGLISADHPEMVRREALGQLANVGARSIASVLAAAKSYGSNPKRLEFIAASHAAIALGKSNRAAAGPALYTLLRYQKRGSPLKAKIITALSARGTKNDLSRRDLETLTALLFQPDQSLAAQVARFLGRTKDRRATGPLAQVFRTATSTALLAEAADALASIGSEKGGQALLAMRAKIPSDPRFAENPDAGSHALRIERAAAVFDRKTPLPREKLSGPVTVLPFRYEGWPGEGRPVLAWTGDGNALALKTEPRRNAQETHPLKVKTGQSVSFDASLVVMRSPGLARATQKTILQGRRLGKLEHLTKRDYFTAKPKEKISFQQGALIEVLAYRAEGFCFVRIPADGRVFESKCPENTGFFETLEEPRTDWWFKASGPQGVSGWFLSDAPGLEFRSREF
ncbi:MAG: hypothetical protein COB53_05025 [Elusimicrobia bacterium]|nr:MAG: hypothetical protein COB53_05025 [Elusimicrobiota bacterium]